jgi:hypothetical protein
MTLMKKSPGAQRAAVLILLNVHPYLFHHNLGVDAALDYHFSRVNQKGKK